MGKIHLSTQEFDMICNHFVGKKNYIRWRDFDNAIEEAFTTKNLEMNIDIPIGTGRIQTFYGAPSQKELLTQAQLAD